MHSRRQEYGAAGGQWAQLVTEVAQSCGTKDILDYGAGKQNLGKTIPSLNIKSYDPGVPEISARPEPADIVVCSHVLPFVEKDLLNNVLEDLKQLTKQSLILVISTNESNKLLDDGSSVTQILCEYYEWIGVISDHFILLSFNRVNQHDFVSTWLPLR